MSFIYNMADTWNAIGTTFNSIYMNISNGAGGAPVGAAASRAFRLDSNGSKIFDVDISGNVSGTNYVGSTIYNISNLGGGLTSTGIGWQNGGGSFYETLRWDNTRNVTYLGGGSNAATMGYNGFGWFSGSNGSTALDTTLFRDTANTLALRNSTTAQKFSVYNTFTDASNYERGVFDWSRTANVLVIGTESAGTGSNRDMRFQRASTDYFGLDGNITIYSGSGFMKWNTDNNNDIGANGANRPRHYYGASWVKYSVVTLASLSASFNSAVSAGVGAQAFVTDLTTASFILNTTAAGGGTLPGPVYSDGTQWLVG